MKTLEDLKALREKLKADMKVRQNDGTKIIIGMGTCGIAAGAREVMSAVLNELAVRKLNDVQVQQTGCIGMCEKEVLVDIVRPGEPRITYGKVKPEDVKKIIAEHVVNGRIVEEMVVGKLCKTDLINLEGNHMQHIRAHVLICGGTGCKSAGSKEVQLAFSRAIEAKG